jgi:hypothetical protein
VEDGRSAFKGLASFIQYGGYAAQFMGVINGETSVKRAEAGGGLAVDVTKDFASKALMDYAKVAFGTRTATVFLGPAAYIALEVLRPEQISADPEEIIHNTSGKYSTKEKQEALASMYKEFGRNADSWNATQRKQRQDLIQDLTDVVIREAKAK